jgi:hypothetical protein
MLNRYGEEEPAHFSANSVAHCELCDDNGYRGHLVCDHIDYAAAAKRGMALIRAALRKEKK